MQAYFAVLSLILMMGMVVTRVVQLKRKGINAMNFGKTDKTDFLILPFALFYVYTVCAAALDLPNFSSQIFFQSGIIAWIGVGLCITGLGVLLWSLISFSKSFRIGIDIDQPDRLITTGVFAVSRNPIYGAFALILVGQFLIYPNWIVLVYTFAGAGLIHRQVLREEDFLKKHYGKDYADYCVRVKRYI